MPKSSIMRISGKATETLRELSRKSGEPMVTVMDRAIEQYRRRVILEETNRVYAKLREDKASNAKIDDETAAWAGSLMDGLDPSETWDDIRPKATARKGSRK